MTHQERLSKIGQIKDLLIEIWTKSTDLNEFEEDMVLALQRQMALLEETFKAKAVLETENLVVCEKCTHFVSMHIDKGCLDCSGIGASNCDMIMSKN